MYILNRGALRKGDIILTSSDEKLSRIIRKHTKGSYSHAILYVGYSSYIHSDAEGVHSGNTQRLLFEEINNVIVLRPKDHIQTNEICNFARSQIGKSYSIKGAINAKIKSKLHFGNNRQFCSKLVAQAYEYAGSNIVMNPESCTPQEIETSPLLEIVDNCIYKASEDEIKYANSESPIEKQTKVTNLILEASRKITGEDIQTLDGLSLYVINNHQFDIEISQIIKDSGYLTLWENEKIKNPWRYDFSFFWALPISIEEKYQLAMTELKNSEGMLERFSRTLNEYEQAHQRYQLIYTEIHLKLYLTLCKNTKEMNETAKKVLSKIT